MPPSDSPALPPLTDTEIQEIRASITQSIDSACDEITRRALLAGADSMPTKERAAAILAEFERLTPADQRKALLTLSGIPESEAGNAVLVRAPDGSVRMQKVDDELATQIAKMGKQGFQTATFTNRRAKRAAAARARRQPK